MSNNYVEMRKFSGGHQKNGARDRFCMLDCRLGWTQKTIRNSVEILFKALIGLVANYIEDWESIQNCMITFSDRRHAILDF